MRSGGALLLALALLLCACGRAVPESHAPPPGPVSYQALVASVPDPEGNALTRRFDSTSDRSQPTAVPSNASDARFTPAGAISYLLPDSIHTAEPAGGPRRTEATSAARVIAAFDWNDDGALAYVAHSAVPGIGSRLVIEPSGGGQPLSVSLPATGGGATPELRFSPDGRLLLLVDPALAAAGAAGAATATVQVRRLDGSLVFGPTAAGPASDATWAGAERLYFQDGRGVNVADLEAGTTRTILPGVRWYGPDASPDGRSVVFEVRDDLGQPRLELLDTATDAVLAGFERDGGSRPRFVSPTEVWFHEAGGAAIVSLDIERRTEAPTGLSGGVTDVRQVRAG